MAVTQAEIACRLHEVIAALDRRTPRVGDAAEADIARDAASLRREAVNRLTELRREPHDGASAALHL